MQYFSKRFVLCASILALIPAIFIAPNAMAALQKVGVVGAADQTLSAINEAKASRKLALGQDIFFNDTLSTDATGKAQLMFIDKSALTVGPNSSVVVDKFVYNPADGGGELTMRGTKGAFRFIGGALSKKQEVTFKTPVGTIGIRGGIAIVEINPTSGATSATFLYGDKMTFQNLAGQKQETTNSGFAISVATPKSMPTVAVAVDASALAAKIQQNFTSSTGQNGGAKVIPTNDNIEKSGSNITGETKPLDSKNGPANNDGDKKQGNGQGQGANNGTEKTTDNKAAAGENTNNNGGNGNAANSNNGNGGTSGNAPKIASLTNDGGYVDQNGVQHSASDLAALRRDEANNGNTANGNGGYVATAANGGLPANGAAAGGTANGVYNNGGTVPAGGTAAAGGYYTPAGVYTPNASVAGSNGSYVAPMAGGYYGGNATTGNYGGPVAGGYGYSAAAPTYASGYNNYGSFGTYTAAAGIYAFGGNAVGTTTYGGTNYYNAAGGGYTPNSAVFDPNAAANAAAVAQAAAVAAAVNNNNTYNTAYSYTQAQIDQKASDLNTVAYAAAIAAGGTTAQATAAGVEAATKFRYALANGGEFTASATAGTLAGTTYISAYITSGGGGGGGGGTTLVNFDVLQSNENTRVNATNLGAAGFSGSTMFSTNDQSIPSTNGGTVAGAPALNNSSFFHAETLTVRETDKSNMCSACSYVKWDAWAKMIPDGYTTTSYPNAAQGYLVPYIYGVIANMGAVPNDISATYTGKASYTGSSGIQMGVFNASITRVGGGATTISAMHFGNVPSAGSLDSSNSVTVGTGVGTPATFSGINLSGGGYSGVASGALFGPAVENIGGKMTYGAGGATTGAGAGVFLGAKP